MREQPPPQLKLLFALRPDKILRAPHVGLGSLPHMEGEGEGPIEYGDLRLQADRRLGCCLFWVRSTALALPSTTASTVPMPGLSPLRSLSLSFSRRWCLTSRRASTSPASTPGCGNRWPMIVRPGGERRKGGGGTVPGALRRNKVERAAALCWGAAPLHAVLSTDCE